jgi:2,4-dienoyl-CoA reductase (NADPH2)
VQRSQEPGAAPLATSGHPHLLSPLDIGPFVLRNRMICTGHNPHYDSGGLIGDQQVAFHRRKAVGGIALSTTGATSVHPSGGVPPVAPLVNFDDEVLPGYRRLAEAMHAQGARMLVQLNHPSSAIASHHGDYPVWAPSQTIGAHAREAPHVMTVAQIEEILDAFYHAAARVRDSGLDGVELNMFAGGLAQQFLSPLANRRTDHYGGSLTNRLRFPIEMIRQCRFALGTDRAVALKIAGDDLVEGGMRLGEMQEVVGLIDQAVHVDYYVVASGTNLDWLARVDHWPPTPASHALYAELAAGIKAATSRPVAALGRIVRPDTGERLLGQGNCDLIAIVRATIADPDFALKVAEGQADEIRPCVGANSGCVDRIVAGGQMRCIHNPIIGREAKWGAIEKAAVPRRVLVIGGGPAGMEAARVAAERGHRVTLLEATANLGGAALLMSKKPGREELAEIAGWLDSRLRRLSVDIRTGVAASVDTIVQERPELVVLATGAEPSEPDFGTTSDHGPKLVAAHAVIAGAVTPGQNVLVYDETGLDYGAAVAELVADAGGRAELVSPYFHPALDLGLTNTIWLYRRLFRKGVVVTPHSRLRMQSGAVTLDNIYGGRERIVDGLDMVAVVTPPKPRDGLAEPLRIAGLPVVSIGDCVAPRDVEAAIFDGHRAGRMS